MVILPFLNESIIPNNLASVTAVVENGSFSVYETDRIRSIGLIASTVVKVFGWSFKILKGQINISAAHVPLEPQRKHL